MTVIQPTTVTKTCEGTCTPTTATTRTATGTAASTAAPPAAAAPPTYSRDQFGSKAAYERAYFGPRCTTGTSGCVTVPGQRYGTRWDWSDPDGNGCDGRQDTVLRSTTDQRKRSRCQVTTADVADWYTGEVTQDAATQKFDVDHVVSLGDAWKSGAWAWCGGPGYCAKRIAYANDPLVLVLTGASLNRSKSDRGPDEWAPINHAAACKYVRRYRQIKLAWGLHSTTAQRAAIRRTLTTC